MSGAGDAPILASVLEVASVVDLASVLDLAPVVDLASLLHIYTRDIYLRNSDMLMIHQKLI